MFSILSCYTMCFLYSFSFFKGRVLHFFILEYDQFLYFLWPTDHIKNSHILPLTLKLYCKPNFNLCRYVQPPLQLDSTPIPNNSPRIPKADLEKVFDKNWQLLTDIEHRKNIFFFEISITNIWTPIHVLCMGGPLYVEYPVVFFPIVIVTTGICFQKTQIGKENKVCPRTIFTSPMQGQCCSAAGIFQMFRFPQSPYLISQ